MKIEISICTGVMLNDNSNPYIESTTVLSDNIIIDVKNKKLLHSITVTAKSSKK